MSADSSAAPLLRVGLRFYAINCTAPPPAEVMTAARPYSAGAMALAVAVLVHSVILHWKKFPVIRVLTDICATGVFLTGLFQILGESIITVPMIDT